MDADLKAKWVAALRSGEYEQGQGQLRFNANFCCLGVLCDILPGGEWLRGDSFAIDIDRGYGPESLEYYTELECGFLDVIGLKYAEQSNLIQMNDRDKKSFSEIADYVEENL